MPKEKSAPESLSIRLGWFLNAHAVGRRPVYLLFGLVLLLILLLAPAVWVLKWHF